MGEGSGSGKWLEDDAPVAGDRATSGGDVGDRATSPGADVPVVADGSSSGRTRVWVLPAIAGLVVSIVLGTLLGLVVVGRSGGDHDLADVRLEPVTFNSDSPFVESVVTMSDDELRSAAAAMVQARADDVAPTGRVSGGTARLYASRAPTTPPCDVARLAERLEADSGVREAWSGIMGVDPDGALELVRSLTPVLLAVDTAVTNHVYGTDGASSLQAVLQAGTPVLVDELGSPRVQCSCGNPLLAPRAVEDPTITGERWEGYDPDLVVEIEPAPDPLETITTVDVETGDDIETRTGGELVLDGLLFTTDDGVYVVDDADRATRVIDGPVREVFDDGRGGLVFQPGDPAQGVPGQVSSDPAERAIWHLPAGSEEPVVVVDGSDPKIWNRIKGSGSFAGSRYVAYSPVTLEWDVDFQEYSWTGTLMVLDVDTGDKRDLEHRDFVDGATVSVQFSEKAAVIAHSADAMEAYWVYDAEFERVDVPCVQDYDSRSLDMEEGNCPFRMPLTADGRILSRADGKPFTPSTDGAVTLVALDAVTLEELDRWTIRDDFAPGTPGEVELTVVDAAGGMVIIDYSVWRDGSFIDGAAAVVDLDTGGIRDLAEISGIKPYSVGLLRSPLIRPVVVDDPTEKADSEDDGSGSDEARSPVWDEFKDAEIPEMCTFDPVRLVDGVNPVLEEAQRHADDPMPRFVLMRELETGDSALVRDVPSDAGPLTAVVAHCSWGGAPDSTPVLFFAPGGEFYAYAKLATIDLPDPRAVEVGRGGVQHMRIVDGEVEVEVAVAMDDEPLCCPSGRAVVRLRPSDGRIEITSIEMRG